MALSRIKTFSFGETLTSADLNAEFNNILNNALTLISPLTADLAFGGFRATGVSAGSVSNPALQPTGDANTGLYFSAADTVDISAGGVRVANFVTASSGVNYLTFTPSATGNVPAISSNGSDTDISLALDPKGLGVVKLNSSVHIGSSTTLGSASIYDETNVRLGIGTQAPAAEIQVARNASAQILINSAGASVASVFQGVHARTSLAAPSATQLGDTLARFQGAGYGATAYANFSGSFAIVAKENFTDSAQGTYVTLNLVPTSSTTVAERFVFDYEGLRIGGGGFPESSIHLSPNVANNAAITLDESTATPSDPASGAQARMYMKADKLVFQYADGATVRYKYLDLTGTGATWTHTTSAP